MVYDLPALRKRFAGALALEGETLATWCDKYGYSYTHIYTVLRGYRESPPLLRLVDEYSAAAIQRAAATQSAVAA